VNEAGGVVTIENFGCSVCHYKWSPLLVVGGLFSFLRSASALGVVKSLLSEEFSHIDRRDDSK